MNSMLSMLSLFSYTYHSGLSMSSQPVSLAQAEPYLACGYIWGSDLWPQSGYMYPSPFFHTHTWVATWTHSEMPAVSCSTHTVTCVSATKTKLWVLNMYMHMLVCLKSQKNKSIYSPVNVVPNCLTIFSSVEHKRRYVLFIQWKSTRSSVVLGSIYFHYMDKNSWNIVQKAFFCVFHLSIINSFGMTWGWVNYDTVSFLSELLLLKTDTLVFRKVCNTRTHTHTANIWPKTHICCSVPVNSGEELEIYTASSLKSTWRKLLDWLFRSATHTHLHTMKCDCPPANTYLRKNKTHQEIIPLKLVLVNRNA